MRLLFVWKYLGLNSNLLCYHLTYNQKNLDIYHIFSLNYMNYLPHNYKIAYFFFLNLMLYNYMIYSNRNLSIRMKMNLFPYLYLYY